MAVKNTRQAEKIAEEARALLARHKVSRTLIAQELDLSASAATRRLNGTVEFTGGELKKLADFLGVNIGVLFGEKQDSLPDEYPHKQD